MCGLQRGLFLSCGLALMLTSVGQAAIFTQDFESDTLGDSAGWTAGTRNPNHFNVSGTPGDNRPTISVINSGYLSSQSIEVVGVAGGNSMHTWRNYGGLSSNGVDPITVSFDFNIVSLENNNHVEFTPFIYHNSLSGFGTNGSAGLDGFGWPVVIRVLQSGFIDYAEEAGNIELLPAGSYIQGDWARVTVTLNGSHDVDVAVSILDGANAGLTASETGLNFQYGLINDFGYYNNALDEMRGFGFYTRTDDTHGFFNHDSVRIDNFSVTVVPEPVSLHMLALGGIFVMGFRRAFHKRFAA